MKKIVAIIIVTLLVLFVLYKLQLRPVDALSDTRVRVTVAQGTSKAGIAALLDEKGLIRSPLAFKMYAAFHRSNLQAGNFFPKASMTVAEIVEVLSGGKAEEISITIPEGYTVKDLDALIVKHDLADAGAISECARTCDFSSFAFLPKADDLAKRGGQVEGYLYPDTYFIVVNDFKPETFLKRLLQTFESRVVTGLAADITASDRSLAEIVTMASLIEEETRKAGERPVVSGILWRRFDEKMGLGVDAAVRYIINKPTDTITSADLEVDSPYNLRKFRGLPPGPIANPSLSSIKAALSPEASPYWYYLHGTDGNIRYAATNDEHNQNRARYLQ